ncbi:tyrosine--tRNA ligase [Patescibacteria group bacterium]|nr:tyrosine--tRNA ligase [Patescibacteria group bacterium]
MVNTNPKLIDELLTRGVNEVIVKEKLREKLLSGQILRVKLGIDPTSTKIHLGRSVPLLKLRDFQELGHQAIFIVGDFTGVIGDTSDKESERPMLTLEQVEKNMKEYFNQAGKILDLERCEFHYNSEWLDKLGYREIATQADQFSVAEFIARDNIRRRLEAGSRVSLREVLYPLMQGYDSVAVRSQVELGGTDQRFNLLAGRTLQTYYGQEPQDIIMTELIEGTDGRKMSSSWGNTINLVDDPQTMYAKVMGLQDSLIIKYFLLITRVPLKEVKEYEVALKKGVNPRDIKMVLAKTIVTMYHGVAAATTAENYFITVVQQKNLPEDIPLIALASTTWPLIDLLVHLKAVPSRSEARRLIEQGGIKVNGEVITDSTATVELSSEPLLLQKGKKQFWRLVVS